MDEDNSSGYLADLLALQTLNTNLTSTLNWMCGPEIGRYFTSNAVYTEDAYELRGRAAIETHFVQIASRQKTRHSVSVCRILILGSGAASGTLLYTRYSEGRPGAPLISVNDVEDNYELGEDGLWRVAIRAVKRAF